jgi:hypothetical protein
LSAIGDVALLAHGDADRNGSCSSSERRAARNPSFVDALARTLIAYRDHRLSLVQYGGLAAAARRRRRVGLAATIRIVVAATFQLQRHRRDGAVR